MQSQELNLKRYLMGAVGIILFILTLMLSKTNAFAVPTSIHVTGLVDYYYTGQPITQTFTVKDESNNTLKEDTDYKVNYRNNINAGTATVDITGLDTCAGLSTSGTFRIIAPDLHSCTVVGATTPQYYSPLGTKNNTLEIQYNGSVLQEDFDYTVTYENNTGIGIAIMTINGINNFTGTLTYKFEVLAKDIASSSVVVSDIKDRTYTGQKITPKVRVRDGSYTLTKGTHYKVSYEDNVEEGTATVIIKGKGNYTGEREEEFTIKKPKDSSSSSSTTSSSSTNIMGNTPNNNAFTSALSNLGNNNGNNGAAGANKNSTSGAAADKAPKTGDNTTIPMWAAVLGMFIALIATVAIIAKDLRRPYNQDNNDRSC